MARRKRRKKWLDADDTVLEARWGSWGIERIAKRLGRTPTAVALRARALGMGRACEGLITMRQMERAAGYDRSRILGVAARLGLRLRRAPRMSERTPTTKTDKHRRVVFSPEQQAKILACIAQTTHIEKLWSNRTQKTECTSWGTGLKPKACKKCKLTLRPHKAHGFCVRCYRWKPKQCTSIEAPKKSTRRTNTTRGSADTAMVLGALPNEKTT